MDIRELTRLDEFHDCLELQREGFGWPDLDLMPVRLFVVAQYVGGLVLGAYDGPRLIGFASAIPGIRSGRPYWHSHMLAVTESYRSAGVGSALKLAQKAQALQRGIGLIEWTFDPLESRNAYLNIVKLGVIVRRYHPNFYGAGALLDSDRVIAEWWLERPPYEPAGDIRRLTIPPDIQSLKKEDPEGAREVQLRVRREFLSNIRDGYFVTGFERGREAGAYIFSSGVSGADHAG